MMLASFLLLGFVFLPATCFASWTNALGIYESSSRQLVCPLSADTPMQDLTYDDYYTPGCVFNVGPGNKVPSSGNYTLEISTTDANRTFTHTHASGPFYLEAGVELNTLNIWLSPGPEVGYYIGDDKVYMCYLLKDSKGDLYSFNNTPQSCDAGSGGSDVLPAPLQCVFGDGSTLDISLGDVDRSLVGAVPGTLPGVEKNINITCTGDGEATYTIGFQYTAVNIAGTEMITSTANGLAVAMSLDDELVSPTDTFTRVSRTGIQTEKLTFEPVRDPSVKISDIPTGAFTASAVVILTLQ